MKQVFGILVGLIITIVVAYVFLVVVESVRLRNGAVEPLIVTGGTCDGADIEYTDDYETDCEGIGFSIRRKYVLDTTVKNEKIFHMVQEEFWLFDKCMLWGWIS